MMAAMAKTSGDDVLRKAGVSRADRSACLPLTSGNIRETLEQNRTEQNRKNFKGLNQIVQED